MLTPTRSAVPRVRPVPRSAPLVVLLGALWVSPAARSAPPQGPSAGSGTPPNVVVILADDFGVDLVGAYGESLAPPCTPNLDQLAADGILFRNAYATPSCLSTRAALLTGRYGLRTGVGSVGGGATLNDDEITLAEALPDYDCHAIGKWHVGPSDPLHPLEQGFERFAGFTGGSVGGSYFDWTRYDNGVASQETGYATTVQTDDAIDSLATMQEPWLLYVAYNAPHTPLEAPPASLCPPASACPNRTCGNLSGSPSDAEYVRAMTEALDTELGRLLDAIALEDPNAYVLFLGDNGTAKQAAQAPFAPSHGKGEVYEGGVNVPFLLKGPGVVQGESAGLVSVVDVFATVTELAGVPSTGTDSLSLVPYFSDPHQSLRVALYAETYDENNTPGPWASHEQAMRTDRYKLIRRAVGGEEFYDLELDAFETTDLSGNLSPAEQAAYDLMASELDALFAQPPIFYCTAGTSANGCRASMHAIGSASATATDGFTLSLQGAEGGRPGLVYFGSSGRQAQPWGNGTSYQCVAPPVVRTGLMGGTGTGGSCDGTPSLDLNALWCPGCPKASKNPGAGALVQAQFWYRDPASTSNQTSSLSNAIEVPVAP